MTPFISAASNAARLPLLRHCSTSEAFPTHATPRDTLCVSAPLWHQPQRAGACLCALPTRSAVAVRNLHSACPALPPLAVACALAPLWLCPVHALLHAACPACAAKMPKKRRNGGRSRHGRGKTTMVDCGHCRCKPPKVSTTPVML